MKKDDKLTKASVQELLQKAQLNKLNIFYDRNAIIAKLCKALLKEWDSNSSESQ